MLIFPPILVATIDPIATADPMPWAPVKIGQSDLFNEFFWKFLVELHWIDVSKNSLQFIEKAHPTTIMYPLYNFTKNF